MTAHPRVMPLDMVAERESLDSIESQVISQYDKLCEEHITQLNALKSMCEEDITALEQVIRAEHLNPFPKPTEEQYKKLIDGPQNETTGKCSKQL